MGHRQTKEEVEFEVRANEIKKEFTEAFKINIILVGPRRSGKSSLLNQFFNNRYSNLYNPTERTELCKDIY